MKRVLQENDEGCGVACVAMLAGVSYWEARVAVFGKRPRVVHSTHTADIRRALKRFGLRSAKRLISFGRETPEPKNIGINAILKVNRRKNGTWHWIVWDSKRKRLLDPQRPAYKRPRLSSFLAIE